MCHCFAALLQVHLCVENLKITLKQKAVSPLAAVHGKNISLGLCLCEYFPLVPYTHMRMHALSLSLSLSLKCTLCLVLWPEFCYKNPVAKISSGEHSIKNCVKFLSVNC